MIKKIAKSKTASAKTRAPKKKKIEIPAGRYKKMVSFALTGDSIRLFDEMLAHYRKTLFFKFSKTDLLEMAIMNLSHCLNDKKSLEIYQNYIKEMHEKNTEE